MGGDIHFNIPANPTDLNPVPINSPAVKPETTDLDKHIQAFAMGILGESTEHMPLDDRSLKLVGKLVYQMSALQIAKHPQKDLIIKIRGCFEERMGSPQVKELERPEEAVPAAEIIDEVIESGEHFAHKSSKLTVFVSEEQPELVESVTGGLHLASASLGMMKTLKDGIAHLWAKGSLSNLKSEQAKLITYTGKLTEELSTNPTEDKQLALLEVQSKLREISRAIQDIESHKTKVSQSAKLEAFSSTAYFTGHVTAATATTTAATFASAALTGIVVGGVAIGLSGYALHKSFEREKELNQADQALARFEETVTPRIQTQDPSPSDQLLLKAIQLKRDHIQNHQKKMIWRDRIAASLAGAAGCFTFAGGMLAILAKAGIAIATVGFAATGIGAGVIVGVGLLAGIGYVVYNFYKSQAGLHKDIKKLQKDLMQNEQILKGLTKHLSTGNETGEIENDRKFNFERYLEFGKKVEEQKAELERLKSMHKLEIQLSSRGIEHRVYLNGLIDLLPKEELEKFLNVSDFKNIPRSKDEQEQRNLLKKHLSDWITTS